MVGLTNKDIYEYAIEELEYLLSTPIGGWYDPNTDKIDFYYDNKNCSLITILQCKHPYTKEYQEVKRIRLKNAENNPLHKVFSLYKMFNLSIPEIYKKGCEQVG